MANPRGVGLWCVLASAPLAGCSLLYDPANLPVPAIDAVIPPDAPLIVDPTMPTVTTVGPAVLYEGQGDGGSKPAVLAITGHNLASNATVTLIGADSAGVMVTLDLDHAVRSPSGTGLAVPVTLPVDAAHGARDVAVMVQLTQATLDGTMVQAPLAGPITIRNLPELTAPVNDPPALAPLYARVRIPTATTMTFTPRLSAAGVTIRATASIELGDVHVDALGSTPGPGGGAGGAASAAGNGPGGGGAPAALIPPSTGQPLAIIVAASGGGYGQRGGDGHAVLGSSTTTGGAIAGDELLLGFPLGGSGGGGGATPGGGAGGSLELSAGGTLQAGTITANGGNGGADNLLVGAAGGGSGGAVLLRAGGALTVAKVQANGGAGGSHTIPAASAGAGGGGRLRFDTPTLVGSDLPAARHAGVRFADDTPAIVTTAGQTVSLIGAVSAVSALNDFDYFVFNDAGANIDMGQLRFVATTVVVTPKLANGYNRMCVTPHGKDPNKDAALTTCADLAYVP